MGSLSLSSTSSSVSSSGHTLRSAITCAQPQCKTTINTSRTPGVLCPECKRQYCLSHRLQDSHGCASLHSPLVGANPAAKASVAKAALARLKAWKTSTSNSPVGEENTKKRVGRGGKNNAMAELMRLKREAGGDQKVPMEKRVWVYVEAEKASTTSKHPKGEFFYSKVCLFFSHLVLFHYLYYTARRLTPTGIQDWSVGKVLDQAAQALQVQNVNNRGDDDSTRLRVFHVEGGRLLDFSEKFGDSVLPANTIVLLRGVLVPDLLMD